MLIPKEHFFQFLKSSVSKEGSGFSEVILPYKNDDDLFFINYSGQREPALNYYRTIDPLRIYFYFPREKVYPIETDNYKRLIVGATACDLRALNLLDKALVKGDFTDPVYNDWRKSTYIISADCEEIADTCHCTLLNGKPYPDNNYDINLSSYEDNFVLQIGSKKGEELLEMLEKTGKTKEESEAVKERIEKNRSSVVEDLREQNKDFNYNEDYTQIRNVDPDKWWEDQEECIGCGACTNICPTCYCMILNDESNQQEFIKVRSQDSCQLHGYSKVAAGDSPRPKMRDRFRNRYLCKFEYMKEDFDELGCVGCGRCIDSCAGEIDIREVMHKMLNQVKQKKA